MKFEQQSYSFPERPPWCPKCFYERLRSGALRMGEFHELTEWATALYEGVDRDELKALVDATERTYHGGDGAV